MSSQSKREALLRHLDDLIEKHGDRHPEYTAELRKVREEAAEALKRNKPLEYANAALRLATLIKFIWDNWPP